MGDKHSTKPIGLRFRETIKKLTIMLMRKGKKLKDFITAVAANLLHPHGDKPADRTQDIERKSMLVEKEVTRWNDTIESFLQLRSGKETLKGLETALRESFDEYAALMRVQRDNEKADIVLNAFYKKGEILDLLKSIEAFIKRLDTLNDASVAYAMGFNNYGFFLKLSVDHLRKKYSEADQKPEEPDIVPDADSMDWFIQNECRQITAVRDLPKARKAVKRLQENGNPGGMLSKEDRDDRGTVAEAMDYLFNQDTGYASELKRLQDSFTERMDAIKAKSQKADVIYSTVIRVLTEEWFDRLDPGIASNPILTMSVPEIKALYTEALAGLKEIMELEPIR